MDDFRILVCYADTGGGHKSAAEAVRAAIEELAAKNHGPRKIKVLVETVVEESSPINAFFVGLYNYLLRHRQEWMKYYTGFIETFKPNQRFIGYLACKSYLRGVYSRTKPDVVVSVHPMVNHYMDRARKDAGLGDKTKLVVVLTDPNSNLWSGWACKGADLTIAPNDLAHNRLIEMGIDKNRIQTIGMPIEPVFVHPSKISREEILKDLGLDPKRMTVLLSGGWAGGGAIMEVFKALTRVRRSIQLIILCGNNKALFHKMQLECKGLSMQTAVLGFSHTLSDLFNAADLLVTKAGGLTTFEAVARRLPMAINLLTEPMPQEMGTVTMLIEAGLAQPVKSNEDIIAIVEKLVLVPDRQNQPLPKAHSLNRVDAIYDIAQTIINLDKTKDN